MAPRQLHDLLAPAVEEWIGADDECTGMQLYEGCESGFDLGFGTGFYDTEVHPLCARRVLHLSDHLLGTRCIVWVDKQGDYFGVGNKLLKQMKPLGRQPDRQEAEARQVAAGPGKTGDCPLSDRVAAAGEDNRDR